MDNIIKEALKTSKLTRVGSAAGGCINDGEIYTTDFGKVFIKKNGKPKAKEMFFGEYESLNKLIATHTVRAPKPLHVLDNPKGGAVLILEFLDIGSLRGKAGLLGDKMAKLHMHNLQFEEKFKQNENYVGASDENVGYVSKFGFHVTTCCGYLPQNNSWCDDWTTFYGRKLEEQISLLEKECGDRELQELWSILKVKIPEFFKGLEIKPSLLHGDLWAGNAGETSEGPVIFDPASFYGHHEYDLAISNMFGGFSGGFWEAYHRVIPRAEGWDTRQKLYKLFHYLNHWNHFGSGYRSQSLGIMRSLCK